MIRQSNNILDIASAVCSHSNRALGFVSQRRVHSLMEGLCRAANSCEAGLTVGALCVACNGLCTAARFHSAGEHPGCLSGCGEGLDWLQHHNQCPTLFRSLLVIWPGTGECISPTAIFDDLWFKIGVRRDRLCIFESGLVDAFVTSFKLRRTHQGQGLNFHELMHGRKKKMAALCPAWAHTYQTMCLGFSPEQLRPEATGSPTPQKMSMVLHHAATTPRNSLVWLKRTSSFIPRGERVRFFFVSKFAAPVTLGVAHARRNFASARKCNELLMRSKLLFLVSFHHVFSHAGNAGNECADSAASLGMRGLVSVSNVPSFWPERRFLRAAPFLRSLTVSPRLPKFCLVFLIRMQLE